MHFGNYIPEPFSDDYDPVYFFKWAQELELRLQYSSPRLANTYYSKLEAVQMAWYEEWKDNQ